MIYHSTTSRWTVGQKKSLEYFYNIEFRIYESPKDTADKIATSLRRIGPTNLVEWSE